MDFKFTAIGRDSELFQLQDDFLREIIGKRDEKGCISYLVSGRSGVGKSKLISEFIDSLENDQRLALHIPKFNSEKHKFEYSCKKDHREPYLPFIEIQRMIEQHYKKRRILKNFLMLLISWLPLNIHDMIEDLEKLRVDLSSDSDIMTDEQKRLEIKTHARLVKNLRRLSRKVPLIFHLKNIQWIDIQSLKLLQSLIESPRDQTLWGVIILEENEDVVPNEQITSVLRRLVDSNRIKKLALKPLSKGYENKLMDAFFEPGLFTSNELDHMYTLSEGYPGLLTKYVDDWVDKKWIYYENEKWKKVSGFEDKIKPPIKKLLDLIIVFLQDGEISPREKELINSNAKEWDISESLVTEMIDLILKCSELGYNIERRVHKGTISEHAFLARNKNDEMLIVEYLVNDDLDKIDMAPRDIHHPRLLPTKEIIKGNDGVLIVIDFYEGKTLREVQEKADEMHILKVIQSAEQITEGLCELHRNKLVHGFLRPETIIKSPDGEIRLTAIDTLNLNIKKNIEKIDEMSFFSYCSPEEIDNKTIDIRSDIFSFGILFFEMLTGELPFKGATVGELKQAIRYADLPDFNDFKLRVPPALQKLLTKCLERHPENRYQHSDEILRELRDLPPVSLEIETEARNELPEIEDNKGGRLPSKKKLVTSLTSLIIIIVIGGIITISIKKWNERSIVNDTIVIDGIEIRNNSNTTTRITPDIIEYLILDDVMQSTDKNIMTRSEFNIRWTMRKQPEVKLSGILNISDFDYELIIKFNIPGKKRDKITENFGNPTALLLPDEGIISTITNNILKRMDETLSRKESTFTKNWDAFEKFYKGEKAWSRLDITYAEECLKSALTYDEDFVLAKLRLAQVMNFNGYYLRAKELISEVIPETKYLSELDSLKALSLDARLAGDYFKEIDLLRQIQDQFPTRKEAAYDLAEAYYQICDVHNAISYYNIALKIDPGFARALNHLAYCYSHLGQHNDAIVYFENYLKHDSTANAFDSYGDGLMSAGLYDRAEEAKKAGINLDPKLYYLWGSLGFINIFQGKFEEARKKFQRYMDLGLNDQVKATGYFRLALLPYLKGDLDTALHLCQAAVNLYDSHDINTRDHEVHWLLGLIHLERDNIQYALRESHLMDSLITKNSINETKYQMKLLKSSLHLKAAIASYNNDIEEFNRIINIFDNALKDKVKDHTSPFDLAFLNNSFGEMILKNNPDLIHLAIDRFNRAINYNPNYALAHFNLWQSYLKLEDLTNAKKYQHSFKLIWKNADADIKSHYNI